MDTSIHPTLKAQLSVLLYELSTNRIDTSDVRGGSAARHPLRRSTPTDFGGMSADAGKAGCHSNWNSTIGARAAHRYARADLTLHEGLFATVAE